MQQKAMMMEVKVGLGGMFLSDYLYKHKNVIWDDFISSSDSDGDSMREDD